MNPAIDTKHALLQSLLSGESYGLELIERIQKATGNRWSVHQGTVYPALRRLEREGLVESRAADPLPQRGGRPRIYYHLTAEGRRVALEDREAVARLFGLTPAPA